MGSNASDVARKNCGFWCFLGVTEMGGVCDLSLWTVPQWKPKWCWDRHSNRHGDDFWLEYGGFLGSRCFFSLLSWENPRWWDKKRTKKRKSNDHIWDIYGIYMDIYQLFNYTKPWRRALSSQLWHAVLMWQRLGSMSRNEGGLTHQMGPESRPALPRLVELGW